MPKIENIKKKYLKNIIKIIKIRVIKKIKNIIKN